MVIGPQRGFPIRLWDVICYDKKPPNTKFQLLISTLSRDMTDYLAYLSNSISPPLFGRFFETCRLLPNIYDNFFRIFSAHFWQMDLSNIQYTVLIPPYKDATTQKIYVGYYVLKSNIFFFRFLKGCMALNRVENSFLQRFLQVFAI